MTYILPIYVNVKLERSVTVYAVLLVVLVVK